MKKYVKPVIEDVELRPEERLAVCASFKTPSITHIHCLGSWVDHPSNYNG
ncbi:MAG TPA: hypothetical protein VF941_04580 [Clostridia bacterium]